MLVVAGLGLLAAALVGGTLIAVLINREIVGGGLHES